MNQLIFSSGKIQHSCHAMGSRKKRMSKFQANRKFIMPRHKRRTQNKSSKKQMEAVKLATAKARLAKIEGEAPSDPFDRDYIRYEDLPPLRPEDAKILEQNLIDLLTVSEAEMVRRRNEWYEKMKHFAP